MVRDVKTYTAWSARCRGVLEGCLGGAGGRGAGGGGGVPGARPSSGQMLASSGGSGGSCICRITKFLETKCIRVSALPKESHFMYRVSCCPSPARVLISEKTPKSVMYDC